MRRRPETGDRRGSREPRLLLVRTSALGDVVHALPVLTALRRHLPAARVAWLVEGGIAPLLEGHPDLDAVVPVRLREWRRTPLSRNSRDGFRDSVAALRDFAPDVALDLMGNHKGALLARLSGAPRVVGLARPYRREPSSALWITEAVTPPSPASPDPAASPGAADRQHPAARSDAPSPLQPTSPASPPPAHAVDRGLALLAALGLPEEVGDFAGERLLPSVRPAPAERPYAFLHPGAGWGNKVYSPERWGAVARRLAAEEGLEVRVSVAPGEEALARRVVEAAQGAARESAGRGLKDLVAELRGARLALGGDTGPLHLAHALEIPVVMVLGPTDPRRHGPYGAPERAVWEALPCSFCYKRFGETKACLESVTAPRVAERTLEVLRATAPAASRGGSGAIPDRDSLAVPKDSRES